MIFFCYLLFPEYGTILEIRLNPKVILMFFYQYTFLDDVLVVVSYCWKRLYHVRWSLIQAASEGHGSSLTLIVACKILKPFQIAQKQFMYFLVIKTMAILLINPSLLWGYKWNHGHVNAASVRSDPLHPLWLIPVSVPWYNINYCCPPPPSVSKVYVVIHPPSPLTTAVTIKNNDMEYKPTFCFVFQNFGFVIFNSPEPVEQILSNRVSTNK